MVRRPVQVERSDGRSPGLIDGITLIGGPNPYNGVHARYAVVREPGQRFKARFTWRPHSYPATAVTLSRPTTAPFITKMGTPSLCIHDLMAGARPLLPKSAILNSVADRIPIVSAGGRPSGTDPVHGRRSSRFCLLQHGHLPAELVLRTHQPAVLPHSLFFSNTSCGECQGAPASLPAVLDATKSRGEGRPSSEPGKRYKENGFGR